MVDDHVHGHGLESYELRGVGDVVERVPGTQDAHIGCVGDNLLHLLDRRWPVQLLRPVRVIAGPVLSWRMILNHRFALFFSCPGAKTTGDLGLLSLLELLLSLLHLLFYPLLSLLHLLLYLLFYLPPLLLSFLFH